MENVYIVNGARTAFGAFGGSFKKTSATELGTITAKEAMKRSSVKAEAIDHVIYGNVIHSSANAAYLARHIGLNAGVPKEIGAYTVNRLCGSGAQSIVNAAQHILLREADVVLAGGAENMSMSPYVNFSQRFSGPKMGNLQFEDMLLATLIDKYTGSGMGMTAEKLAEQYSISREEQDQFSIESNLRAAEAMENGCFAEEIVPVEVKTRRDSIVVNKDEHIKPNVTTDSMAKLKPSFKKNGTVTAGNASGINDGAASVIVASKSAIDKHKLQPIARIVSWGTAGVDPTIMGIGPVPAIKQALARANLALGDIDLFEINEAFAAQYLAVEKQLGLERSIVNVHGGAIALGHPVGVSGTRITLSAAYELRRRKGKYAVASLCIGGGQGIALVMERI
ncbi:acetyl-CoA C-acetyltransferase [Virgibacillus alimentarius]|uniref:acetyl-CoA C-acetyltransferase n=1 Tax=Virgibacillus alimentarius TaxID=698769 RepID=A0ABS4SAS1_9BACI|nr:MULTISPECIES: acetyl-CoA C-acetyltransferase [Virgibacillus]MBP2258614.1 acetyl-CoA C-acetyltransferase/acetyl-CoA acyltransferase 2 [Virgibacillus alimentarius]HLR66689.1 acetyl-CoA C-acetyltransferase [Virgibacillus sp.]